MDAASTPPMGCAEARAAGAAGPSHGPSATGGAAPAPLASGVAAAASLVDGGGGGSGGDGGGGKRACVSPGPARHTSRDADLEIIDLC